MTTAKLSRGVMLASTWVLAGALVAPARAAQTDPCARMLELIEEDRYSLEGLEQAEALAHRRSEALSEHLRWIDGELDDATGRRYRDLRAQHRRTERRLRQLQQTLPPIERQAEALARQLDSTEREYIRCVQAQL